jgi:catechol 2,3-dioxygenase-like lactoylglutathione lyase family enzyme
MIIGAHTLIYAKDAEKARAFFRDVLRFPHVDAGEGWLIFALPPGEVGIHPAMGGEQGDHELHLMCDDVQKTVAQLKAKGVTFTQPIVDRGYGICTALRIPGGGELGLYQPRHPLACSAPKAGKTPRKKSKPARKVVAARAGRRR